MIMGIKLMINFLFVLVYACGFYIISPYEIDNKYFLRYLIYSIIYSLVYFDLFLIISNFYL